MAVTERVLQNGLQDLRSDKSLVRAAQSGRSEAYAALVKRYYPKVYSFVSHLLSSYRHRASAPGADDLTQEVFTRALNSLPKFNGDYRFGPWLLRIARNLCVDETRRDSHRAQPADPIELPNMEPMEGVTDDVWDSVSKSQVAEVVRKALSRIPMRQRTVLILREIEGWSYADIAPVVGTNVRGVEATLRRARARFRLEATNFDSQENERAICRRVTHLAAADPGRFTHTEEAHIEHCEQCRLRTTRIRGAEKLFGLLPPIGGGGFSIRSVLDAVRPQAGGRGRIRNFLFSRDGIRSIATSPVAHIAEAATALVVATAVAVSAGPAARSSAVDTRVSSLEIVAPVFASAPVSGAAGDGTKATTALTSADSPSRPATDDGVDFSNQSLLERSLLDRAIDSSPENLLATTLTDVLEVDSWEATDAVFTELETVVEEAGELSADLGVEDLDASDLSTGGSSLLNDLTAEPLTAVSVPRSYSLVP